MVKLVKKETNSEPDFLPHVLRIADIAQNFKAKNIHAFDVSEFTTMTDCIFMCSASSAPQLKAIFSGIKDGMKEVGLRPFHSEGQVGGSWWLLDYDNIFVHVFKDEAYDFYDLEDFWADAKEVNLELDEA